MIAAMYVVTAVISLGRTDSSMDIDRLLGISLVQAYQYFSGTGAGDSKSQRTFVSVCTSQWYTHFQAIPFP